MEVQRGVTAPYATTKYSKNGGERFGGRSNLNRAAWGGRGWATSRGTLTNLRAAGCKWRGARVFPKFVLARLVARPVTPSKRHTFVIDYGGETRRRRRRRLYEERKRQQRSIDANSRYLATDDRLDDGRLEFVRLFRTLLLPPFLEKTTLDAARIQN